MIDKFESYYHYFHEENYSFKGHSHPMWEINIILDGEMEVVYDDRMVKLNKNMVIVYEPEIFHSCKVNPQYKTEHVVYHFSSNSISVIGGLRIYELNDYQKHIMSLIQYECEAENYDGHLNLFVNDKARILLDLFLMKLNEENNFKVVSNNKNAIVFENAVRYMKKNVYKNITVAQTASASCVSVAKLKTIFTNYTGTGIIEYFHMLKLVVAKDLLQKEMSIKEVSEKLNFSSQAYFSLWFKKQTGISPIKYVAQMNMGKIHSAVR